MQTALIIYSKTTPVNEVLLDRSYNFTLHAEPYYVDILCSLSCCVVLIG